MPDQNEPDNLRYSFFRRIRFYYSVQSDREERYEKNRKETPAQRTITFRDQIDNPVTGNSRADYQDNGRDNGSENLR